GWQGMVRQWQETFYEERYSASNMQEGMPDVELLCSAYGMKGLVVERPEDLSGAVAAMLAHNGPVVLDVRVKRDENCYPMVAPGKSNAQMLGLPEPQRRELNALIQCGDCGAQSPMTHRFCPECGAKL
ncbi:MAG: thiamine pyrophosphate-dependent enzyme, partial [Cyanobacteriota bacterium]|nr:thiamine pyrophosphate-dependent enzyme [Cyanobacteriota bacterium]